MSSFESLSNPNHFIRWYDDVVDGAENLCGVDCEVYKLPVVSWCLNYTDIKPILLTLGDMLLASNRKSSTTSEVFLLVYM